MQPEPAVESCEGIGEPLYSLTFDDGPSDWTEAVLDELAAHDAHATFFVLGAAVVTPARRQTLERIVRDGCELGNHTFSHPALDELSPEEVERELALGTAVIERTTGVETRHWRAPYLRSTSEAGARAAALGLREVRASIVPSDYSWPADQTASYVLERLRPGAVVCLHDGRPPHEPPDLSRPTRDQTVSATRAILEAAAARGLRSVTVAELLTAADG
jgi:peptidoglycan/xylan/chitin deacetylase (PgdA/CDA1 family)